MRSPPVAIHALVRSHRQRDYLEGRFSAHIFCWQHSKSYIKSRPIQSAPLGGWRTRTAVLPMDSTLSCKSCGSRNLGNFPSEIAIHFPGRRNLSKPHVLVFPEVLVCFDCGIAQLAIPEAALRQLTEGREAGAGQIKDS